MYKYLKGKFFRIGINGDQDKVGRSIYNILGGVLGKNESTHLLSESNELADGRAQTIAKSVLKAINNI